MIGNSIIMELIMDGVLWWYISYDHKAALETFNQIYPDSKLANNFSPVVGFVPPEILTGHVMWRVGKIRSMKFDSDGLIERMYIGHSSKFAKRFFPSEVGKFVKPILKSYNDKYGLLSAGLAVDENYFNVPEGQSIFYASRK
jgi:hypothetical protein